MSKNEIILGLAVALLLALCLSPFASPFPDGLEKVAETKSFLDKGFDVWKAAPLPDYLWPGLKSKRLATGFAGIFGTFLVFLLSIGLARLRLPRRKHHSSQ